MKQGQRSRWFKKRNLWKFDNFQAISEILSWGSPQLKISLWKNLGCTICPLLLSFLNILRWRDEKCFELNVAAGTNSLPSMDPLGAEDGSAWGEDHQEDHYDAEQDEGAGPQREILQVTSCQCSGHGWRFRAVLLTATQSSSSSAFHGHQPDPDRAAEKWRIYQVIWGLFTTLSLPEFQIFHHLYLICKVREIFIFYIFTPSWNFSQFPSFPRTALKMFHS